MPSMATKAGHALNGYPKISMKIWSSRPFGLQLLLVFFSLVVDL
jgi:hypothetical protein